MVVKTKDTTDAAYAPQHKLRVQALFAYNKKSSCDNEIRVLKSYQHDFHFINE